MPANIENPTNASPTWLVVFSVLLACYWIFFFAGNFHRVGELLRRALASFRELPLLIRPVIFVFVCCFVIVGSVKTNSPSGGPPMMMSPRNQPARTFSAGQFKAGFALARTGTVSQAEFEMPPGAETFTPWTVRGAFHDYLRPISLSSTSGRQFCLHVKQL